MIPNELLESAPADLKHVPAKGRPFDSKTESYVLQVSPEDCTGCDLCVAVCPAESKEVEGIFAIKKES